LGWRIINGQHRGEAARGIPALKDDILGKHVSKSQGQAVGKMTGQSQEQEGRVKGGKNMGS